MTRRCTRWVPSLVAGFVAYSMVGSTAVVLAQDGQNSPPNILLIIADDYGVANLGAYTTGPNAVTTHTFRTAPFATYAFLRIFVHRLSNQFHHISGCWCRNSSIRAANVCIPSLARRSRSPRAEKSMGSSNRT